MFLYEDVFPMTDAAPLVARHPHPAFARVAAAGYGLWYWSGPRPSDDPDGRNVLVVARGAGGPVVGKASFVDFGGDYVAAAADVAVSPGHRRRGIATAMYVLAEVILGRALSDAIYASRSADGEAHWGQPDRPFGRAGSVAGSGAGAAGDRPGRPPNPPTE